MLVQICVWSVYVSMDLHYNFFSIYYVNQITMQRKSKKSNKVFQSLIIYNQAFKFCVIY